MNADLKKMIEDFMKYFDDKATVEITGTDAIAVNITSENSSILIGKFGATLEAIQYVMRMMANKVTGERVKLSVDVAGYKATKNRELEELALSMADNVSKSGYPQSLRPMNSYERRIIHTTLTDFPGVEIVSVGEEPMRYIEIKPKK